jgi:hypothetical protein
VQVVGEVPVGFAASVRSELGAGLSPSNIDVCEVAPSGSPEALARVSIRAGAGDAHYSLDVTDSVTQKRVGRDLALTALPADGRPLALAVAAEELLRASWAELALRGVHSPQAAPPPEVRAIVEDSAPSPVPPRRHAALGARLGFEHFLGGQTHYGAELFGLFPFGPVAGGFLALGARRALSSTAPRGSIGASAVAGELGLSLTFVRQGGLDLSAFVSARALRLTFEPVAVPEATAHAQSGWAVTSRAGFGLAFGSPGLLRSYSTLGAGLPLKSFSASDSGSVVTGASELELLLATGLALELP